MCGRARCSLGRNAVMRAAHVASEERWRDAAAFEPRYNASPGAPLPVLMLGADGQRELRSCKWGLVPSFTRLQPGQRPDHYRMFNARCESLAAKPVFSRLLLNRRCVVLMDGFYEWATEAGGRKQPFHISTAEGPQQPAMYLAGLYDTYTDANGETMYTVTVVTTDSSRELAWLHDRMPVILTTQEEVAEWLGEGAGAAHDEAPEHPQQHAASPAGAATGSTSSQGGGEDTQGSPSAAMACTGSELGGTAEGKQGREPQPRPPLVDPHGGVKQEAGATHGREADLKQCGAEQGHDASPAGGKGRGRARADAEALVAKLCRPYGGPLLKWYPVTPEMGKPSYDKPDCCKDVRTKKGAITSFFKPATKPATAAAGAVESPGPTGAGASAASGERQEAAAGPRAAAGEVEGTRAEAVRNPDECEAAGPSREERGAAESGQQGGKQGKKRRAAQQGGGKRGSTAKRKPR